MHHTIATDTMAEPHDSSGSSGSDLALRTEAMPGDMQLLLNDIPRDSWETHEGFKPLTQQWLNAHQMFRRVSTSIRTESERFLDAEISIENFLATLAYQGIGLVGNLHGHHHWEDHSFFPELHRADARFRQGLDILEKDHEVLNQVLDDFINHTHALASAAHATTSPVRSEAGTVHRDASRIEALLQRHLSDEEELAVPIILHHRLRG